MTDREEALDFIYKGWREGRQQKRANRFQRGNERLASTLAPMGGNVRTFTPEVASSPPTMGETFIDDIETPDDESTPQIEGAVDDTVASPPSLDVEEEAVDDTSYYDDLNAKYDDLAEKTREAMRNGEINEKEGINGLRLIHDSRTQQLQNPPPKRELSLDDLPGRSPKKVEIPPETGEVNPQDIELPEDHPALNPRPADSKSVMSAAHEKANENPDQRAFEEPFELISRDEEPNNQEHEIAFEEAYDEMTNGDELYESEGQVMSPHSSMALYDVEEDVTEPEP